jgi:hypothetical protein
MVVASMHRGLWLGCAVDWVHIALLLSPKPLPPAYGKIQDSSYPLSQVSAQYIVTFIHASDINYGD